MSPDFRINVDWLEGSGDDAVERAAFAQIVIEIANQAVTELEDLFSRTVRPGIRASAYDLACWLAENWWRLRWEPGTPRAGSDWSDWRLSHCLAAAGNGFAWPDISFTSDGAHVQIDARRTWGSREAPVRYIRDMTEQISATDFEQGLDDFIERVLARLSAFDVGETELGSLWRQLQDERADQGMGSRRRLEALLGFDREAAPDDLIACLTRMMGEVGHFAVEEIAAAEQTNAPAILNDVLDLARSSDKVIQIQDTEHMLKQALDEAPSADLPWQRAERLARIARKTWGIGNGPIPNDTLSDLFGVSVEFFDYTQTNGVPLAAGWKNDAGNGTASVVMRAKNPDGRRFEFLRLVGDYVAASSDRLLPATKARTDRQKLQRAFAQEFLLPFEELDHILRDKPIGEEEMEDIADEYSVSPLLVRMTLTNRGLLTRGDLFMADHYN